MRAGHEISGKAFDDIGQMVVHEVTGRRCVHPFPFALPFFRP